MSDTTQDDGREQALSRFREQLTRLVSQVNHMTEEGILGAGDALQSIVREAKGFIEETEATMATIDAGGDQASVTRAIEDQSQLISTFVRELSDRMETQDQVATQAESTLKDIAEAGATIDRITRESRMLALNALIETHRLGQDGRSLAVIADHMKQLSETVADANEKIDVLSEHLLRILPQLAEQARGMRSRCEDFSEEIDTQIQSVAASTDELRDAIAQVRRTGNERLDRIVDASHTALAHLAFQDPMSQQLGRVAGQIDDLERRLFHGDDAGLAPEPPPADDEDAAGAGEMLLF